MRSIDEQIRKAMEEGQFDNLPGKGKPLRLDDNPMEDPEWRMAYRILKGSGFTLPWIETRQEILNKLDAQRQALRRAWAWRQSALAKNHPFDYVEQEWQRALNAFRDEITRLDKRIRDFNLEAPNERFQLLPVQVETEIEKATSSPNETSST